MLYCAFVWFWIVVGCSIFTTADSGFVDAIIRVGGGAFAI